jgi:hypothetical protein
MPTACCWKTVPAPFLHYLPTNYTPVIFSHSFTSARIACTDSFTLTASAGSNTQPVQVSFDTAATWTAGSGTYTALRHYAAGSSIAVITQNGCGARDTNLYTFPTVAAQVFNDSLFWVNSLRALLPL